MEKQLQNNYKKKILKAHILVDIWIFFSKMQEHL